MSTAELQKHKKVSDILGFIKAGNLKMVHGLIKFHQLDQSVMLLRGFQDEFAFAKGEKLSMKEWNPLLIAIAFKRLEIVRYFT